MIDKRAGKVTITEVAKRAGVSTATAGRVLGSYGYSSEDNKKKVRKAAKELGYRPNLLARGLITGRTKTIGVIAGDIQSPFYASILRGIADIARSEGFGVLLTNSDEMLERELEAVQLLLEKQVDGLILAPCDTTGSEHLHAAISSGCPVVQIDRTVRDLPADSVTVNSRLAARRSVGELIALGHRRIAMVAELEHWEAGDVETFIANVLSGADSPAPLYPSWQRFQGYVEAHLAAGLSVDRDMIVRVGVYSVEAARRQTQEMLARADRPTAIFTADGLMSAGVMDAITAARLQLPCDLSLICFDDLDWMSFLDPGITAIAQPLTTMGETAARLMLERLKGKDGKIRHVALEPSLSRRGSVAAPPALTMAVS